MLEKSQPKTRVGIAVASAGIAMVVATNGIRFAKVSLLSIRNTGRNITGISFMKMAKPRKPAERFVLFDSKEDSAARVRRSAIGSRAPHIAETTTAKGK